MTTVSCKSMLCGEISEHGRCGAVQVKYLLFESASGYSLFSVKPIDNVALSSDSVQKSVSDMARFSKIVSLSAFKPFSTAVDALEQINSVSESLATDMLLTFLKTNLPKVKEGKKAKFSLGVTDPKLANAISESASTRPGFLTLMVAFVHSLVVAQRAHMWVEC
jgi:NOP5NT (NUC127) domain